MTPAEVDAELMRRAQADEPEAFAHLYDRHATRANRVARSVCRNNGRAEDIVQEGFLTIWRNRASFRQERGSFQAWSMGIIRNRAIDSIRTSARRPQLVLLTAQVPDAVSASPSDEVIARSEGDALRELMAQLPAAQAEVISLAFFGELTHTEIATLLDLPKGTVKGRMRLGMEKLRKQLEGSAAAVGS